MKNLLIIACLIALFACNNDQDRLENKTQIQFSLNVQDTPNQRVQNEEPSSIAISIENSQGEEIVSEQKISITSQNDGYVTEPILLVKGSYNVTEFLVLDENDDIIYATPSKGSILANYVENPLPLLFEITESMVETVTIEVVRTHGTNPSDWGYSSLTFNIIPTDDILISVLALSEFGEYEFVESAFELYNNSSLLANYTLGDSINLVKIRKDFSEYDLHFKYLDNVVVATITTDSLLKHRTSPLTILMDDLNRGLVSYYPFDGNANDLGTANIDGIIPDGSVAPILTSDRNDTDNAAYYFNEEDQYIDLSTNDIFSLGKYENFSISIWFKPSDIASNGVIFSKAAAAGDNRYWLLQIYNQELIFRTHDLGKLTPQDRLTSIPVDNTWQHLVVTLKNGTYTMYHDNLKIQEVEKTVNDFTSAGTTKTLIGAVYHSNTLYDAGFEGSIDDIRLYNRALSILEIEKLFNL